MKRSDCYDKQFKIGDKVYLRARDYPSSFFDRRRSATTGRVVFIGQLFIYVSVSYFCGPPHVRFGDCKEYRRFKWQLRKVKEDERKNNEGSI